jgi:hypothetical protein
VVWGDHIYLKMEASYCLRNTTNVFYFHTASTPFTNIYVTVVARNLNISCICAQLLHNGNPFFSGNYSVETLYEA